MAGHRREFKFRHSLLTSKYGNMQIWVLTVQRGNIFIILRALWFHSESGIPGDVSGFMEDSAAGGHFESEFRPFSFWKPSILWRPRCCECDPNRHLESQRTVSSWNISKSKEFYFRRYTSQCNGNKQNPLDKSNKSWSEPKLGKRR